MAAYDLTLKISQSLKSSSSFQSLYKMTTAHQMFFSLESSFRVYTFLEKYSILRTYPPMNVLLTSFLLLIACYQKKIQVFSLVSRRLGI